MTRGYTLVELMVTVALIGIGGVAIDAYALQTERAALAELQRARAGVLMQYHARRVSSGQPLEPAVIERLSASLPEAKVERVAAGELVTLTATWRVQAGIAGRKVLTVFAGSNR
ncbi:MAG: prepilin-type N-terminal cleavage/methylation domain-containing protein [Archangium sp.]|nr:prepilin-type N-terminal cleavage/methylation domain-containing protein [Archangium sp.]